MCNFSLRSSKLAFRILREGKEVARDIKRSREVMIGRWSALSGQMLGLMLQEMIGFKGLFEHHTLSGLVQLPSAVSRVGILAGRAICMLYSCNISIRGSMRCGGLYNLRFLSSSQSGWCLLKSPSQSIWSVGRGRAVARFSLRYVWRASMARLLLQSL